MQQVATMGDDTVGPVAKTAGALAQEFAGRERLTCTTLARS